MTIAIVSYARAEPLSTQERAWDGLSELLAIAQASGVSVLTPARLEVAKLAHRDALLIVHPLRTPPVAEIAAFLRGGGRLAIVDDFGSGDLLLQTFGIARVALERSDLNAHGAQASVLRGNPALVVAKPRGEHPLSRGVAGLATNHPSVLHHPELAPVFALGDHFGTLVLSGAVGEGRLVAVSDSSVLINNMLELDDNRVFAQNLVRYLTTTRGGKLYIADSDTELVGALGLFDAGHPLRAISDALTKLASLALPKGAVVAITIVLALLLLTAAATALPRRAAYARRLLETPECVAGFAGRVRLYARAGGDFLVPTLTLKQELESRLIATLRLRGQPQLRDTLQALRERGFSEALLEDTRSLLLELDALHTRAQGEPPRIPERKFVELVGRGRSILAELEPPLRHSP